VPSIGSNATLCIYGLLIVNVPYCQSRGCSYNIHILEYGSFPTVRAAAASGFLKQNITDNFEPYLYDYIIHSYWNAKEGYRSVWLRDTLHETFAFELRLKGAFLFAEDEEDATHIIYPTVDPMEEEYARPVFRRGNSVLVHWYYFPDSHDTWAQADLPVTRYCLSVEIYTLIHTFPRDSMSFTVHCQLVVCIYTYIPLTLYLRRGSRGI
jgi:hypothetical protein